jgi:hypothetical protein
MDFEQPAELKQRVTNLVSLGYLRKVGARYAIGNAFLQGWLDAWARQVAAGPVLRTSSDAMRSVFARQREGDASSLIMQLNLRRGRLVELETVRGERLLSASPQLLAEIGQLESEIGDLRAALQLRGA